MMRLVICNGDSLLLDWHGIDSCKMSKAKETTKKASISPTREGGKDAYCTERLTALMAHVVMPEALILTVLRLFL